MVGGGCVTFVLLSKSSFPSGWSCSWASIDWYWKFIAALIDAAPESVLGSELFWDWLLTFSSSTEDSFGRYGLMVGVSVLDVEVMSESKTFDIPVVFSCGKYGLYVTGEGLVDGFSVRGVSLT